MKKLLAPLSLILLIGAGCASAPPGATPSGTVPAQPAAGTGAPAQPAVPQGKPTDVSVPNPGGINPENSEDRIVVFDGERFTPQNVAVHVGHTITWRNDSAQDVWPLADPYPSASPYPEFDAGQAIAPGQSWSFTFKKEGAFPYHNKLQNGAGGVVTVTPVGK